MFFALNTKIYMKMIDFRRGHSITLCSNIEWGLGEKFTYKSDATYGHDKIMLLLKYYKVFFSMFICYFMFFSNVFDFFCIFSGNNHVEPAPALWTYI